MKKYTLSNDIEKVLTNVQLARVQEMAKELSDYGLAVAMPHLHDENNVDVLPKDTVQYEDDQKVTFLNKEHFESTQKNAFPVMWRFDKEKEKVETCAWCHSE